MRELLTEEDEVILLRVELRNTENRFGMINRIKESSSQVRLKFAASLQGSELDFYILFCC